MDDTELLAHLTSANNEASIRSHGLLTKQEHSQYGKVIYFHRLRPLKGSHTLDYLIRYARVSNLIVVVVDPESLDKDKLKTSRYEAIYFDNIPPDLLKIHK